MAHRCPCGSSRNRKQLSNSNNDKAHVSTHTYTCDVRRCLHNMPSKIVIACNVLAFMFALSVPCWKIYETSWAFREAADPSQYDDLKAPQHGKKETLVVPARIFASSGRAPGGQLSISIKVLELASASSPPLTSSGLVQSSRASALR